MASRKRAKPDRVFIVIALILSCNVLFFYGLPVKVVFLLTAALAGLFVTIGGGNALLASLSFAVGTLFFSGVLKITKRDEGVYFRPQEILSVYDESMGHRRYKKNASLEMEVEHGDLLTISSKSPIAPEPRHVIFQTDELGFRNADNYHGQEFLLVGDSFVVGTGTTQDSTLSAVLRSEFGVDTYNLSHPGKIRNYENYIDTFRDAYGDDFKVLLFMFEGNDFPKSDVTPQSWITNYPVLMQVQSGFNAYHKKIKRTSIYRYTFSLRHRYARKWFGIRKRKKGPRVIVHEIGGVGVGFHKKGIDIVERDWLPRNQKTEDGLRKIGDRIARIFFIPGKYRVYYNHIEAPSGRGPDRSLPNRQWEYAQKLGELLKVPVTDLTPALVAESDKLLEKGKLTYYRDDTHWNKHGIRVAAGVVAETLSH